MKNIIHEGYTSKIPKPVTIKGTEIILKQMKESVCKIYNNNNNNESKVTGTGFFAKIPNNNEITFVLITNNHVLTKERIKKEKKIYYSLGNDNTIKYMLLFIKIIISFFWINLSYYKD